MTPGGRGGISISLMEDLLRPILELANICCFVNVGDVEEAELGRFLNKSRLGLCPAWAAAATAPGIHRPAKRFEPASRSNFSLLAGSK